MITIFTLLWCQAFAQESALTMEQAIDYALKNNAQIKAADYEVASQRQLKKTSFDLPKADVTLLYGQYNNYPNDNNITVTQSIPFTVFGSQGALNRSLLAASELKNVSTKNELVYRVKQTYFQLSYAYSRHALLLQQDSIFEGFFKSASLRYKTGETNLLEQTSAEVQRNDAKNKIRQNESDITVLRSQLKTLLMSPGLPDIQPKELTEHQLELSLDTTLLSRNPSLSYSLQQIEVAKNMKKVQSAKMAPDLLIGFFNQTLTGTVHPENGYISNQSDRFTGFQIGVSIPLWSLPYHGRVKAAALNTLIAKSNFQSMQLGLHAQFQQALLQVEKNRNSLNYYRTSALPNADLILKQSQAAFKGGEIGYGEYLLGIRNSLGIKEAYLQSLLDFNQSIIFIEFLSGNK